MGRHWLLNSSSRLSRRRHGLNQALTTGMVPLRGEALLEDGGFLCKPASSAPSSGGRLQCTIETPYLVENRIIMYRIAVESYGQTWYVHRRFQEFMALSDTLKKLYPKDLVPKLPSKTLFNNRSEEFVSKRSKGLQQFLNALLECEILRGDKHVAGFLQTELTDERLLESRPDNNASRQSEKLNDTAPGSSFTSSEEDRESPTSSGEVVNLGRTEKQHVKPKDFDFMKVIGRGSYGKVMLAKHRTTEKHYAVKVLNKKHILRRNESRHIMQERDILVKVLHHPFLVGLNYSFQTSDKLYFVLDFVNGGELFFHLQKSGNFNEPRAKFYAAEITCALAYLHSQGIIYRDLKPENILLDNTGHIVLTDFGLCKEGLKESETTSTFCGTPEYLAPEVIRKEQYDKTVDWWCLGSVIYEMLTGLPPFYSRNNKQLYDNILHQPLTFKHNVSSTARSLLTGLLEKDKKKRLGAKEDGDEVKAHAFFNDINWTELERRRLKPPFIPTVSGKADLNNIDPEFTKEPVPQSVARSNGSVSLSASMVDNEFKGFSYAPQSIRNDPY
ncbi:serine/threonine-protein kinase Sgk2-like isoform X2 [Varroa jacobsoni]|uniref:Uncharacterized protein n=1 Tax=Varroa destructor TaxID=109461 RepID=A0A7M7JBD7_VARDE|nr:serine/threonine-protein kinase Sgk2-like isoform X2 [Varroa destructor]XP_022708593.1 serine/threonine-protein kinase Sgk2-like isoform X2 [Varroa jacobsoni]